MFIERLVPVAAMRLEVAALELVASTSISRLANSSARVLQAVEQNLLRESGGCGDRVAFVLYSQAQADSGS